MRVDPAQSIELPTPGIAPPVLDGSGLALPALRLPCDVVPPPRQGTPPVPPPVADPLRPGAAAAGGWLRQCDRLAANPLVRSWVLSAVFHTSLILVLGAALLESTTPVERVSLEASFEDLTPQETPLLETQVVELVPTMEVAADVAPSAPAGDSLDTGGGIEVPIELTVFTGPTRGNAASAIEPGLGAAGPGLGQDGKQSEPATEFFGVPARGDRFVFVVDGSGSMADFNRIERAKDELEKSIRRLKDYQQFYIIFFNQFARPMPEKEPVPATPEKLEEAVAWMRQIQPEGFTDPRNALLRARQLKPDAIFLLSDGAFDPLVANQLLLGRGSRTTPIHTIAFTNRSGERVLKQISGRTGGMYRFVP